jgi:hypothetical protein
MRPVPEGLDMTAECSHTAKAALPEVVKAPDDAEEDLRPAAAEAFKKIHSAAGNAEPSTR